MPKGKQNPESILAQLIAQLGLSVVEYLVSKKKTEARAKAIQVGRAKSAKAKDRKPKAVATEAKPRVRKARAASVGTTGAASEGSE